MGKQQYYLAYKNGILMATFDGIPGSESLEELLGFCNKESVNIKQVSESLYYKEKKEAEEREKIIHSQIEDNLKKELRVMAKNDQWCEFCDDKIKGDTVRIKEKEYEVCSHCKALCPDDESQ